MTLQTNDGSHITYVGNAGNGTIYHNNGVKRLVATINNRLLVNAIVEPNGSTIGISYASQSPPQCNSGVGYVWRQPISSITDTLGRVVIFNYDDCNNLSPYPGPTMEAARRLSLSSTIKSGAYQTASAG